MAFWWVNQGDNYRRERADGYLWAPVARADGGRPFPHWTNMQRLNPGDVVFTYSAKLLRGYCIVTSDPTPWEAPYESYGKGREGLLALADYHDAPAPLSYRAIVGTSPDGFGVSLDGATPKLQTPDKPSQGYLYALTPEVGQKLAQLVHADVGASGAIEPPKLPAGGTSKLRLATARVGQGEYGRAVRDAFHGRCAVTGLSRREAFMLHAAHIKP